MHPLVTVVKIFKKKLGVTGKIWEKAGVKVLKDLTEKSINFSALATSSRAFAIFCEVGQQTKSQFDLWEKITITEEKHRKMTL